MKRIMTTLGAAALLAWPAALSGQQSPELMARGAEVWATNCVRCHNVRPSSERTDAQWVVIVSHMRARANLTRTQARSVTAFLQMTNMPEGAAAMSATAPELSPAEEGASTPEVVLSSATLEQLARYLARLGVMVPPAR